MKQELIEDTHYMMSLFDPSITSHLSPSPPQEERERLVAPFLNSYMHQVDAYFGKPTAHKLLMYVCTLQKAAEEEDNPQRER